MHRATPVVLVVLLAGGLFALPRDSAASDPACRELDEQVADLTKRVEALERQLRVPRGDHSPPAAANNEAEREALALYSRVDVLLARGEIEEARAELSAFQEEYAGTPTIRLAGGLTRELAVIGKPTPESWAIEKWFQGEFGLDGRQTTLLIFWEVWCPHCKREVPRLDGLYSEYKDRGLQVLGLTRVTRSATEDAVRSFIAETAIDYPVAKETGTLSEYFNVKGIPAAALVKEGAIVWRGHPMRLTDEMLRAWL